MSLTKARLTNLGKAIYPSTSVSISEVIEHYLRLVGTMLFFVRNHHISVAEFLNGSDKPDSESYEKREIGQTLQSSTERYHRKRDFSITPELACSNATNPKDVFVVQEHHARNLHYDFRLEKDGVLRSWAVPKGVPKIAGEKRLAIQTEDHPLAYVGFEGIIPSGEYGAGDVRIVDEGKYELKSWSETKIEIVLHGRELVGSYHFVRFKKAGKNHWLLMKTED